MFYNDDFFKRTKTIVRCTLRVELELKVTKVDESKKVNFCDVLCLDVVFDVDSNK